MDGGSADSQRTVFEVSGLTKSFGKRRVLTDITFSIGRNEVFGILGPNGAGKTTLVRHLVGFSKGDHGRVDFLGRSVTPPARWVRDHIGYMPQAAAALNHMTCEQALYHTARIRGLTRHEAQESTNRLLDLWEIADRRHSDSYTLSGGETRLLRLAVTMVGQPQVLVLDEPTAHMDIHYRRRVHRILEGLANTTTIVIVTHDTREASGIFNRAVLLSEGSLQALGSPRLMCRSSSTCFAVHVTALDSEAPKYLSFLGLQRVADDEWTGLVNEQDRDRLVQLRADGCVTLTSSPGPLEEVSVGLVP